MNYLSYLPNKSPSPVQFGERLRAEGKTDVGLEFGAID